MYNNKFEDWCSLLDTIEPCFVMVDSIFNYREYKNVNGYFLIRTNFNIFFVNPLTTTFRHRLDGPAILYSNGEETWCINNHDVTDKITKWAEENNIDLDNLSEHDKLLIKLVWADYGK